MLLQVCDRPEVTEIGIIQPIAEHETRTVTLLDHSDKLFNNAHDQENHVHHKP